MRIHFEINRYKTDAKIVLQYVMANASPDTYGIFISEHFATNQTSLLLRLQNYGPNSG